MVTPHTGPWLMRFTLLLMSQVQGFNNVLGQTTTQNIFALMADITTQPPHVLPLSSSASEPPQTPELVPEPRSSLTISQIPENVIAAFQILKQYAAQRQVLNPGLNENLNPPSAATQLPSNSVNEPGNSVPTNILDTNNTVIPNNVSSLSLAVNSSGSPFGSGNGITPARFASFSDFISQIGEASQEGQLAEMMATLNVLQSGSLRRNFSTNHMDAEAPEQATEGQPQTQYNRAYPKPPPPHKCPTASSSSGQIQSQTGLVLPLDRPENGQFVPRTTNQQPTSQHMPWGENNVQQWPQRPIQTFNGERSAGMQQPNGNLNTASNDPMAGFQQPSIKNTGLSQNTFSSESFPSNGAASTPDNPGAQTPDLDLRSLQNWNTMKTTNQAYQNSPIGNVQNTASLTGQGYQVGNYQGNNVNSNLLNMLQPNGNSQPSSTFRPESNSESQGNQQPTLADNSLNNNMMSGQKPDPNIDIFQPLFGGNNPTTMQQVGEGQMTTEQRNFRNTNTNNLQNQFSPKDQFQQQAKSQIGEIMAGKTSDIATYYQTSEGKLIRVIPYLQKNAESRALGGRVNQAASKTSASPQQNVTSQGTRNQAPVRYVRLQQGTQRLNVFGLPFRQFQQSSPRRVTPQNRFFAGSQMNPFAQASSRQVQLQQYPQVQQRSSQGQRQGQETATQADHQRAMQRMQPRQQPFYLPRFGTPASFQSRGDSPVIEKISETTDAGNGIQTAVNNQAVGRSSAGSIKQVSSINQLVGPPRTQSSQMSVNEQLITTRMRTTPNGFQASSQNMPIFQTTAVNNIVNSSPMGDNSHSNPQAMSSATRDQTNSPTSSRQIVLTGRNTPQLYFMQNQGYRPYQIQTRGA